MATKPLFSKEDRMLFSNIFINMDDDGNGWLSREELKIGLGRLGCKMTDQQAEKLFRKMDENEDGKITYDEFLAVMNQFDKHTNVVSTGQSSDVNLIGEIQSNLHMSGVGIVREKLQLLVIALEKDAAGEIAMDTFLRHFRL